MSAADPPPADADRIIAMIDKNEVLKAVETAIEGTDLFVVDVEVSPAKSIIVEVDSPDGRKLTGVLASLGEDDFTLEYQVKEKLPGKKRPEMVTKSERIPLENVKKASYLLRFK